VDVYGQLRAQGFQLERHVFHVVLEVFLNLGRWQDALSVMDDMAAQVLFVRCSTISINKFSGPGS
jgi:pentatricopeptide repeat protein